MKETKGIKRTISCTVNTVCIAVLPTDTWFPTIQETTGRCIIQHLKPTSLCSEHFQQRIRAVKKMKPDGTDVDFIYSCGWGWKFIHMLLLWLNNTWFPRFIKYRVNIRNRKHPHNQSRFLPKDWLCLDIGGELQDTKPASKGSPV